MIEGAVLVVAVIAGDRVHQMIERKRKRSWKYRLRRMQEAAKREVIV